MNRTEELTFLMEAKYQRSQQPLKSITAREILLREELEKLKFQLTSDRQHGLHDCPEMYSIGASLAWEKWVEKTRKALNLELATVLAEKQKHLMSVKINFGKFKAVETIAIQAKLNTKLQTQEKQLEETIAFAILRFQ
ncbi:MAG: hypothetical protein ABJK43_04860 [Lentilitoribacter sp.]